VLQAVGNQTGLTLLLIRNLWIAAVVVAGLTDQSNYCEFVVGHSSPPPPHRRH